jgi:hypothetical protein
VPSTHNVSGAHRKVVGPTAGLPGEISVTSRVQILPGALYIRECSRCFIVEDLVADDRKQQASQRASLIALGVVVLLFVLGWFLTRELYSNQKIEDCVLSGRTNCVPIDAPSSY